MIAHSWLIPLSAFGDSNIKADITLPGLWMLSKEVILLPASPFHPWKSHPDSIGHVVSSSPMNKNSAGNADIIGR